MFVRDKKKRKRKMNKWIKKFVKYGLVIAIIAFLIWWLLHLFGDMQGTIIGLQDQINQQNGQINQLQGQLQVSLENTESLKVKINGLEQYIVHQNEIIHDLTEEINQPAPVQPQIGEAYFEEKELPQPNKAKDFITDPGVSIVPILLGAMEIGRKLILPGKMIFGGM